MILRVTLLVLVCISFASCLGDRITGLRVQSGERRIFVFSGGGFLQGLVVRDISQSAIPKGKENRLWEIESESDLGKHVLDVANIEYGVVPDGYRQTFPQDGKAPKELMDGMYLVQCATSHSVCRPVFVEVQSGKVIAADNQSARP